MADNKSRAQIIVGLLTALGVVGGAIVARLDFSNHKQNSCSSMQGYPKGYWNLQAVKVLSGERNAIFGDNIEFTEEGKGVWYADQKRPKPNDPNADALARQFTVRQTPFPRPGAQVDIAFKSGGFSSDQSLFLSQDGCSMVGRAQDSFEYGRTKLDVAVQYCWNQALRCPKIEHGWRPPNPH